jgi:RHS repeat-associated protein
LSSVVAITDATGTLISQQRYLPFGQVRTNVVTPNSQSLLTDLSYTGQRDLGMGLMDYHARFYSPVLGRFTQPDTLIPNAENPQAWNRYSYVMNSPILYNRRYRK